jgi:hypothetical protein
VLLEWVDMGIGIFTTEDQEFRALIDGSPTRPKKKRRGNNGKDPNSHIKPSCPNLWREVCCNFSQSPALASSWTRPDRRRSGVAIMAQVTLPLTLSYLSPLAHSPQNPLHPFDQGSELLILSGKDPNSHIKPSCPNLWREVCCNFSAMG